MCIALTVQLAEKQMQVGSQQSSTKILRVHRAGNECLIEPSVVHCQLGLSTEHTGHTTLPSANLLGQSGVGAERAPRIRQQCALALLCFFTCLVGVLCMEPRVCVGKGAQMAVRHKKVRRNTRLRCSWESSASLCSGSLGAFIIQTQNGHAVMQIERGLN